MQSWTRAALMLSGHFNPFSENDVTHTSGAAIGPGRRAEDPMDLTKATVVAVSLALGACAGGSPTSGAAPDAELRAVHHGRLVDVYGLRDVDGVLVFSLYRTDEKIEAMRDGD